MRSMRPRISTLMLLVVIAALVAERRKSARAAADLDEAVAMMLGDHTLGAEPSFDPLLVEPAWAKG